MNNNKADGQNTSGTENLRTRASARSTEKKHRASFLVVDLFLLIGVIAVIFLLVLAFTPLDLFVDDAEPKQIVYTVEISGVDKDLENAFREGDAVVDAQTGTQMGVITQVTSRVYEAYIDKPTQEIDPTFEKHVVQKERNEEWRVITINVSVTAEYRSGIGYTVDTNRIAVGREYSLRFPSYVSNGECVALHEDSAGEVAN